jgi:predicted CoA-binding protein
MDPVAAHVLRSSATWAVVGLSPNPARDSHAVAAFLQRSGYRVIPVNRVAAGAELLGERVYASVAEAAQDHEIDVVDVFRRSEHAGAHVDEAIAVGARAVWLQLGVIDHAAAERARGAGLEVVMDRCPAIDLPRLRAAS